eukprot:TRINITY_DN21030_c0_g1_i2.p1 TRINITY_DN21030_c0_g1~~TRINITY_DN21030_c0_g1_i2.p1  ORF type:complete len:833 (-),score=83.78 TRINITY_DN21030_c0_g1_i2:35-2533(-)
MVSASLAFEVVGPRDELPDDLSSRQVGPAVRACIPKSCITSAGIECRAVRRGLLEQLLDVSGEQEPEASQAANLMEESTDTDPLSYDVARSTGVADTAPPFVACIDSGYRIPSNQARAAVAEWKVRFRKDDVIPSVLRFQVWRPIRVGWLHGERSQAFQLVGENRFRMRCRNERCRRRGHALSGVAPGLRRFPVPSSRQLFARSGDMLLLAIDDKLRFELHRTRAMRKRILETNNMRQCTSRAAGMCRFWPHRRVCQFEPSSRIPAFWGAIVGGVFRLTSSGSSQGISRAAQRQSDGIQKRPINSISFEFPYKNEPFAIWFLEYVGNILRNDIKPSSWTFLPCLPSLADANRVGKVFSKLVTVFGATVGISMRCGGAAPLERVEAAKVFLETVDPYGPWVVLASNEEDIVSDARDVVRSSPSGLGVLLRDSMDTCTMLLGHPWESLRANAPACVMPIESSIWPTHVLQELIAERSDEGIAWSIMVFSCNPCRDLDTAEEPLQALDVFVSQASQAVHVQARLRSVGEVSRLMTMLPGLDVGEYLEAGTTYEELMTLRQQLKAPELALFEDKIQLRRNLLQPLGVQHTPTYYMSNDDPGILSHIAQRKSYVVKPSHMTEGEHVSVVHHGKHVFDVRVDGEVARLAGEPVDEELLQSRVLAAWNKSAYEWECEAVVAARPGVIVERLVLSTLDPGAPDVERVEEARCHVVWGRVMAIEWAVGRQGSFVMTEVVDSSGRRTMSTDGMWAVSLGESYFRDPDGWVEKVTKVCLPKIMEAATRVATGARTDHLRVDLLVNGQCDEVYVSEVELFPAVPFAPIALDSIERRWRYGYGFD